jgi:phosphatidate cytidylyltransferase
VPTGQVRIIGAERAADAAGDPRAAEEDAWIGAGGGGEDDEDAPADGEWEDVGEPELQPWTEAPTGEVPAVLSRPDEPPRGSVPEPSWREEPGDWELGGAILDEDGEGIILGERDISERQPWSFELETGPGGDLAPGGVLDEFEDAEAAGLFAPWPEPAARTERAGGPPPGAGEAARRPASETWRGGWDDDAWREGDAQDAATGGHAVAADEFDVEELAGEKTSVLPTVGPEPPPDGRPRQDGVHEQEAAALEEDLRSHGLRRVWQMRRPETVRGTTARHRARGLPAGPSRPAAAGHIRPEDRVSQRAGRNLPVAVASGVVIGAIVLVAFHFGTVPSMVVVTAALGLAAAEGFAAFRHAGYRPVTLLGIAAVVAVLVGTYDRPFQALPVVVPVLVAFTFLWHLLRVDERAEPVRSSAATLLVFCWVGVFGSFAALLLAPSLFPHRHGIAYLLGALIAAVAYDVGALAVGAGLGRHPLSPVSPGKTWEGVAGGAVLAIALSLGVVPLIHPWTLAEAGVLGAVVAVVSPVGDLCESLVKRHLGLKDMGRLLPGHGGLLDRVDGLLFVLPATYYLLRAFGHG